jgi:signal peptidase I
MEPDIKAGDTIEIHNDAYAGASDVRRGDVVVFAVPDQQPERLFVKRVLGLPGDRVSVNRGRVAINGVNLPLRAQQSSVFFEEADPALYRVTISGECSDLVNATIPEGHFYVVGDNRCASTDSRTFGAIPFSAIRGKQLGS